MKLSLRLLHAEISVVYPDAEYLQRSQDMPQLSSSSIITSMKDPADDVVYIHLPSVCSSSYEETASVITCAQYADRFPRCDLVVLPESADLLEMPSFIASVFSRYFSWSDSLYDAIARNSDLQTLIDLTVPMIGQPMYFADAGWKMLAHWSGDMAYVNPIWSYQMKFAYLPYHVYQGIIDADDMGTYRDHDEAVFCEHRPGFGSIPFISKAIRKEGKHYGNYFIIGLYRELDARDFEVAEHLGNVVATALYGDSNYLEASTLYSSHFIIDVIEGSLSSVSLMTDQLHALKWSYSGDYCLAQIVLGEEDAALANHVMLMVNGISADANSFTYQGNVLAVFNRYSPQQERIKARLAALARDFNTVVTISTPFARFDLIRAAYLQSKFLADHVAGSSASASNLFDFSDCFLDYLAQQTEDVSPLRTPIARLYDHDVAHGTDYCRTLYYWLLLERNTVKTAGVLFVHRNTLKNRIAIIQRIIGVDLESPSTRLQLIVGLHPLCAEDVVADGPAHVLEEASSEE